MILALTLYTCLLQFAFVLTVGQITSHAVFLYLYIRIFMYFAFLIVLTCIYTLTDHFPLCGIQFAMDADFWNQSVWFGRRAVWLALINYPMIRYWIAITSIDDPLLINKEKKSNDAVLIWDQNVQSLVLDPDHFHQLSATHQVILHRGLWYLVKDWA